MRYRVIRLDARYSYYHLFQYLIEVRNLRQEDRDTHWLEMLHWCHTTWGWSVPADTTARFLGNGDYSSWANRGLVNRTWTYSEPQNNRHTVRKHRIYLRGGPELSWFRLAHPVDPK